MTEAGWKEAILEAVRRAETGDRTLLNLMALLLTEQDQAKQQLRELGYGCIGMSWLDVVAEIRARGE
jgi:hypothetical protein